MIIKRFVGCFVAGSTLILNYYFFFYIAKYFGSGSPDFIAFALTVTLFVHELFHLIAYEISGIPSFMIFLIFLGGAGPIPDEENLEKVKQFSWERDSFIILAGVIGNYAVIIISYIAYRIGYVDWHFVLRITNLNAIIILWNMFPIWRFDGGQFAKRLFNSVSENRDTKYEIGITLAFLFLIIIILFITGKIDPFNIIFLLWGLHYWANHDDPEGSYDSRAIPFHRQKYWAAFYLALITISVFLLAITPVWIKTI